MTTFWTGYFCVQCVATIDLLAPQKDDNYVSSYGKECYLLEGELIMTLEDQDMITGMQGVQMALVCLMDRQQALYLGYELQDCCVNGNPHSSEKNQLNCKILWEYFL